MNMQQLKILERAFSAEIDAALMGGPGVIQTRSKVAKQLEDDGYLSTATVSYGGRMPVTVTGYGLTHAGRHAYCSSELCKEQTS